jgi:hypothetical protein
MSKTIEVKRSLTFGEMSQEDPQVKAWFDQSFRPIGPYYKGKTVGTGLSFEEQKILLPLHLSIESNDKGFRLAVTDFYHNILTRVPIEGLELEIGLEDDSKPLSEDNMPLNLKDYITYRHIIGHLHVAKDEDEAQRESITKKFYLVDTAKISAAAVAVSDLEDKAIAVYFEHKDNLIKVDQVLTMSAVDIRSLSSKDKQIKFKQLATKDTTISGADQVAALNKFIDLCKDEDLPLKYMVEELIGAQILERVGASILYRETGSVLGDNMREAVLHLKSAKNSKMLNILKAEYQVKVKKESSLAPETFDEKESVEQEEAKSKKK